MGKPKEVVGPCGIFVIGLQVKRRFWLKIKVQLECTESEVTHGLLLVV